MDIIFLTATCSRYYSNWYRFEGSSCQNRFLATYEIEYEIDIMNFNEFDKKFILLSLRCFLNARKIILKEITMERTSFFDRYFYRLIVNCINKNIYNIFFSFYISNKKEKNCL